MRRGLLSVLLLAGCAPPVEETATALTALVFSFMLPLLGAAMFSCLSAWALIAIQEVRRGAWARSDVVWPAISCLFWSAVSVALAVASARSIQADLALPEAGPLRWFVWPGPETPAGTVLLGASALVLLALGVVAGATRGVASQQDVGAAFD